MAQRTLPGLSLTGFWDLGYDGWKTENDANLLLTSAVAQLTVKSRTTVLPGSPVNGDIYIVVASDGTNPNKVAVRDNGAWSYFAPQEGWLAWVQDTDYVVQYNGTAWEPLGGTAARRVIQIAVTDPNSTTAIVTGDGQAYFRIPAILNNWTLVGIAAAVITASSSGLPSVQIRNTTTGFDMLTTTVTIDATETDSLTAATAAVIDSTRKTVATGNILRVDVKAAGTGTKGLIVELTFQQP